MAAPHPTQNVTDLLQRFRAGDQAAADTLLPLVYDELHAIARGIFAGQRSDHTLQPTALVHEAWMKLAGGIGSVEDRRHFFVLSARAMRQVLTDYARGRNRQKRGGGVHQVTLDAALLPATEGPAVDLLVLEESLDRLAMLNERHARVVELRYLGGLTIQETADTLGVSHGTVESDWAMARAWLRSELTSAR
jgi:RNA polymerase sigma factor (TIGR02999 family)